VILNSVPGKEKGVITTAVQEISDAKLFVEIVN
jgi:hypothetical protein